MPLLNPSNIGDKTLLVQHVCPYLDPTQVVKLGGLNRNCHSAIFEPHVRPSGEKVILLMKYYHDLKIDPLLANQLKEDCSCHQFLVHVSKNAFKQKMSECPFEVTCDRYYVSIETRCNRLWRNPDIGGSLFSPNSTRMINPYLMK